jgi:protein phosphatase
MALVDSLTAAVPADPGPRPRDEELDLFGLTHQGKVRRTNQDHFLICTIHPQTVIHGTSLPSTERLPVRGERLATIMMVADGVGSGDAGGEASQLAVETITRYAASALGCYHANGRAEEEEFYQALRSAALEAHAAVVEAAGRTAARGMATTLTLGVAVYPRCYVVQVGDSRCYRWYQGTLQQITRDQTMAQDLADRGALAPDRVADSPLSHVLLGAIGGREAMPVVSRFDIPRGSVVLLCTDGLTKHVSDAELAAMIGGMTSSEQLCRSLLDLALDRGGSDNITILAGRAPGTAAPA